MVDFKNWLGQVDDDTFISKLSIPGTHNSAACHHALPSVQCQGKSIEDQLENGVRFLDIRLSRNFLTLNKSHENDLIVIHGKFPIKLTGSVKFKDTISKVYKFLEENRSETVIVSIKQEGAGEWDNDNDEFPKVFKEKFINGNEDRWYLNTGIPRLRDCRGKVILFRRFGVQNEDEQRGFGIPASSWPYNTEDDDRGAFRVQDFCEITTEDDISKKANYVKNLINKAKDYNTTNTDPKLFINFCSGSNFFDRDCWPEKVTDGLIESGIDQAYGKGAGIIILDYCEKNNWKLVKSLVEKNF